METENLKKLLLSFNEEDYNTKVDLHIHSNESDGEMTPEEIVKQAKKLGKQYISISDHNSIDAYLNSNILSEKNIIPSVEFDCIYKGVLIHILAYGIDIYNEEIKKLFSFSLLGKKNVIYRLFKLRKAKEVIQKIKLAGGISVLAHPACYWCFYLDKFVKSLVNMGLDGIETYYPYRGLRCIVKFHSKAEVKRVAEKYNLIKTGGSDTHGKFLIS